MRESYQISIKEENRMYCEVLRLYGRDTYWKEARKCREETVMKGKPPYTRGQICERILESMPVPDPEEVIETSTMGAYSKRQAMELIASVLNDIKHEHPEMELVSPIEYTETADKVYATIIYKVLKIRHPDGSLHNMPKDWR